MAYPEDVPFYVESRDNPGEFLPVDHNLQLRMGYINGYEQAEEDIIAIIESRIAEILGDAQPKPTIRIELKELITRIKEANEMKTQELTWQDVQRIVKIADDLLAKESKTELLEAEFQSEESYYKEILKRFKEAKSCGSH